MSVTTSIWDTALAGLAALKAYMGGDEKADLVPVVSEVYNIAADNWNKLVASVAEIADRLREPQVGEGYITAIVADTIATALTWQALGAGATWSDGELDEFTHSGGVLTYTGEVTRKFFVLGICSVIVDTTDVYQFAIGTSATAPVVKTQQSQKLTAATGEEVVAVQGAIELDPNDTLRMIITSETQNGPQMTAQEANFLIKTL